MKDNNDEFFTEPTLTFLSKKPITEYQFKEYYATPQFPGDSVPVLFKSLKEASEDIDDKEKLRVAMCNDYNTFTIHDEQSQFSIKKFFSQLTTHVFGQHVLYAPLLSSTQTICLKYIQHSKQGLVVLADRQTTAKGRGANIWGSPPGCLTFSFKCLQMDGKKLPFLQYLAGIAVVDAINSLSALKNNNSIVKPNIQLKWPNDIYGNGVKIGGILCQSNYHNDCFDVVVGIGLNVTNEQPTLCINQIIKSLLPQLDSQQIHVTREEVLSLFFNKFEEHYIKFSQFGFAPFEKIYTNYWIHKDQIVKLQEVQKTVKIIGINETGYLKAVEVDPETKQIKSDFPYELHPDGTSFDLKDLVLKKKEIPNKK
eukprot:gene4209-5271_t